MRLPAAHLTNVVLLLFLSLLTRWSEQLSVYLRTNKQNQKKKRKVEPVATQVATFWSLNLDAASEIFTSLVSEGKRKTLQRRHS